MAYDALRKGRVVQGSRAYLVTAVTYRRALVFRNLFAGRIVVREMRRLHEQGEAKSLAWVLMPDHLHWLIQLPADLGGGGENQLAAVMKGLKGRTAREVNKFSGRKDPLWQRAFHDRAIRDGEDLRPVARYLVANPLRAGLVDRIEDYPLWDAAWL